MIFYLSSSCKVNSIIRRRCKSQSRRQALLIRFHTFFFLLASSRLMKFTPKRTTVSVFTSCFSPLLSLSAMGFKHSIQFSKSSAIAQISPELFWYDMWFIALLELSWLAIYLPRCQVNYQTINQRVVSTSKAPREKVKILNQTFESRSAK